jgi:hypothetical protein
MTPQALANIILALIEEAQGKFLADVGKYQQNLHFEILQLVKGLEVKNGIISPNGKNIKLINNAKASFEKSFFTDAYAENVSNFLANFDTIVISQNKYLKILDKVFDEGKAAYTFAIETAKEATYNSLTQAGLEQNILLPIKNILNQSITTGSSYKDMVANLQTEILGNAQIEARYVRYAKQITTDSLNQFSRNYMEVATQDLGLQWFFYSGSNKETTRDFCSAHARRIFHISEIKGWANDKWAGKIPTTNEGNIMTFLGGYNCGHQLIPVSEAVVPAENLKTKKSFAR